ncbi:MAG: sirohydrochlorin chelatase [Jatrophihabitans sp.]
MTLVLVGHGSRDPRSAAGLHALADRVRTQQPSLDVRLCFLELSLPSVEQALAELVGDVIVVPLLLGNAFHARSDIPERVSAAALANGRVHTTIASTLGPDPDLDAVLAERAAQAPEVDGWVLAATGSTHPDANETIRAHAPRLGRRLGLPVCPGFVTCAAPEIAASVAALRDMGCCRVGVLPWFLASGVLLDRGIQQARSAGATVVAAPLADSDVTARVVLSRHVAARGHAERLHTA